MDENQVEETETSTVGPYISILSTAAAVGFITGVGIALGNETTKWAIVKIQDLRTARAAKKAAQTED